MAAKRCIPTDLFYNRKFVRLRSDTIRLILIGLIADADDAGRGLADPDLLGRKLDQRAEQIQEALDDLAQAGFVETYTIGEETYYSLRVWHAWQKLSKPTPSHYPAPPSDSFAQGNPGDPREAPENRSRPRETRPEEEGEGKEKRKEDEGEDAPAQAPTPQGRSGSSPHKVVPFPRPRAGASIAGGVVQGNDVSTLTRQVARILKLPVTEALTRLVAEYAPYPSLSLLGEADAAREWLDNPERNDRHQRASPAFFRRWLKREQEAMERRHSALQHQATGTGGAAPPATRGAPAPPAPVPRPPNLMHLADDDQRARGAKR